MWISTVIEKPGSEPVNGCFSAIVTTPWSDSVETHLLPNSLQKVCKHLQGPGPTRQFIGHIKRWYIKVGLQQREENSCESKCRYVDIFHSLLYTHLIRFLIESLFSQMELALMIFTSCRLVGYRHPKRASDSRFHRKTKSISRRRSKRYDCASLFFRPEVACVLPHQINCQFHCGIGEELP